MNLLSCNELELGQLDSFVFENGEAYKFTCQQNFAHKYGVLIHTCQQNFADKHGVFMWPWDAMNKIRLVFSIHLHK